MNEEYVPGAPAGGLRPFVSSYCGYRTVGAAPGQHRGLPSPYLTFIVTLDDPLVIAGHPDPSQAPSRHTTLLGGLHTAPATITHPGRQSGIQVNLDPLAARALLGLPAGQLAGLDLDAADVLGRVAGELHERVRAAATWPTRFEVVDDVLLRLARQRSGPGAGVPGEVTHAWRLLRRRAGRVGVSQLSAEVGWSRRHLAERFRTELGLAPKAAARVVRFDAVRRRLQEADPEPTLAVHAAQYGYYDQAHLAREFRALAGCPPSTFLAELRNVQAGAGPAAAGSLHD